MMNPNTEHEALMAYKAPSWATDWCPHCGWSSKCGICRAWQD